MSSILSKARFAIRQSLHLKKWNVVRVPGKYRKELAVRSDVPEYLKKLLQGKLISNRTLHYIKRRYINCAPVNSESELDEFFDSLLKDHASRVYWFVFDNRIRFDIFNDRFFGVIEENGDRVSLVFPVSDTCVERCISRWRAEYLGILGDIVICR